MANDISGNPVFIDTPGIILKTRFKFGAGSWQNAPADATVKLLDNVGRVLFESTATQADYPTDIPPLGWVNGLVAAQLTGGVIILPVTTK